MAVERTYAYPFRAVFDSAVMALPRFGMTLGVMDPGSGTISATTQMSLMSWGEKILIQVAPVGEMQTSVSIRSRAVFGRYNVKRNQRNVDQLHDAFDRNLSAATSDP